MEGGEKLKNESTTGMVTSEKFSSIEIGDVHTEGARFDVIGKSEEALELLRQIIVGHYKNNESNQLYYISQIKFMIEDFELKGPPEHGVFLIDDTDDHIKEEGLRKSGWWIHIYSKKDNRIEIEFKYEDPADWGKQSSILQDRYTLAKQEKNEKLISAMQDKILNIMLEN